MGINDGTVLGTTKVVDNGPDESKWCLVITGDGFTSSEMGAFETAVDDFVVYLEAELTGVLNWDKVNVIRMDVESDDSGADNMGGCSTPNPPVDTFFDAEHCIAGLDRTLRVDESLVIDAANTHFPEWDALLVLVNSTEYGGLGSGGVAVASLEPVNKHRLALHEMGHAAFNLADEYEFWAGCSTGETTQNNYPVATAGEPVEANVTATLSPLKWDVYVDPATPIATTTNVDCSQCDPQSSPVPPGTVGAFEGARYHHCDAWRPEFDCRMRKLDSEFWCAVCSARVGSKLTWGSILDLTPCFVATAVYSEPLHPEVQALRQWRRRHLESESWRRPAMRAFVWVYGWVGPPLSRYVGPRRGLAAVVRNRIVAPIARGVSPKPNTGGVR